MKKPHQAGLAVIALVALLPHFPGILEQDLPRPNPPDQDGVVPAQASPPPTTTRAPNSHVVSAAEPPAATRAEPAAVMMPSNAAPMKSGAATVTSGAAHPADVGPLPEPTAPLHESAYAEDAGLTVAGLPNRAQVLLKFEEQYAQENYDQAWAEPLETEFYQTLANDYLANSSVVSAACRTTLCRFAVTHANAAAEAAFMHAFMQSPALVLNNQNVFHYQERDYSGVLQSVYFLARNGVL